MYYQFHYTGRVPQSPSGVPTWNGSFVYQGQTYNYTMLGANPASSNTTTTIPVDIIPVRLDLGHAFRTPLHKLSNGKTVIQNTVDSPVLHSGVDFVSGGQDLGNTQYIDAFQRGNFWNSVQTNTNYHTLLGTPKVLKTLVLNPGSNGAIANAFGVNVMLVNINWIDGQLQNFISSMKIPAGTIPIFVTYNSYLTFGSPILNNCCIGGYHSFTGTNVYMNFEYLGTSGVFSQDVSALSHEVGEAYDDPYTNNGACGGLLEVGDPLENEPNYGDYPYALGGFTYHLQDLTYLPYFGAPANTSVNNQFTFQGTNLSVCQNGG